jgi:hypothetical protein
MKENRLIQGMSNSPMLIGQDLKLGNLVEISPIPVQENRAKRRILPQLSQNSHLLFIPKLTNQAGAAKIKEKTTQNPEKPIARVNNDIPD